MKIRIILKSGVDFIVKCDKFTIKRNGFNQMTGLEINGITENAVLHMNFDEIAAIVRVLSDEINAEEESEEIKNVQL